MNKPLSQYHNQVIPGEPGRFTLVFFTCLESAKECARENSGRLIESSPGPKPIWRVDWKTTAPVKNWTAPKLDWEAWSKQEWSAK